MKKTKVVYMDFPPGRKPKSVKTVHLNLVQSHIESHEPVTREFRDALKFIAKFYEDNKRLHAKDYRVRPSVQAAVIALTLTLRKLRLLRGRWVAEIKQDLRAFHSIEAEDELKRVLASREKFLKRYARARINRRFYKKVKIQL